MAIVLVVDDEPDALEILQWVLQDWGHEVHTAGAAPAALDAGERCHPDVLITDFFLGGDLSGADVIRLMRERNPQLFVILMTGMRKEELRRDLRDLPDIPVVQKPFSYQAIRSLIDQRSGHPATAGA